MRQTDFGWLDVGAAGTILVILGIAAGQTFLAWDTQNELFLRLALAIALLAIGFLVGRMIWFATPITQASWWKVGGNLDSPTWEDVRRMAMDEFEYDPIAFEPKQRIGATQVRNIAAYTLLGGLLIDAATLLATGPVIGRLLTERSVGQSAAPKAGEIYWELSANLTALLALITALITIFFAHYQFQAKVKADSRQAWINKLRERISNVIALADSVKKGSIKGNLKADLREFNSQRLEMELLLNPSERDHRLLMYLSLRLAFWSSGNDEFSKIHDVKNLEKAVRDSSGYEESKWSPIFEPIPSKRTKAYNSKHHDLVGYTLRLESVLIRLKHSRCF